MTRLLILAVALACLSGCASQERRDADPLVTARQMQAMGLQGRVVIVFGGSHAGGLSWNITGSSGFAEIVLDPSKPIDPADLGHEENTIYDSDPPGSAKTDPQGPAQ